VALLTQGSVFVVAEDVHNPIESFNEEVEVDPIFNIDNITRGSLLENLLGRYSNVKQFLSKCEGIDNWKKVAKFDTKRADSCPSGLRTVVSSPTGQTACGRRVNTGGCASVVISIQTNYTKICGVVRGYQFASAEAFGYYANGPRDIDSAYVDGVSITQGSPRKHIWTYAVRTNGCPCALYNTSGSVPSFVGDDLYCDGADVGTPWRYVVVWDDPLWDGSCYHSYNQCCRQYGWFNRTVSPSDDDLELRICADQTYRDEDALIESYEFWIK
jgi:dynein heavy chain